MNYSSYLMYSGCYFDSKYSYLRPKRQSNLSFQVPSCPIRGVAETDVLHLFLLKKR